MAYIVFQHDGHTPIDENDHTWHLVRYGINSDGAVCGMGDTVERNFPDVDAVQARAHELFPHGRGDARHNYMGRVNGKWCYCARPAQWEIASAREVELRQRLQQLKREAREREGGDA